MLTPNGRAQITARHVEASEGLRIAEGGAAAVEGLNVVGQGESVGQFFDMAGNVLEWCAELGDDGSDLARGERRKFFPGGTSRQDIGFRVVLDLGNPEQIDLGVLLAEGEWDAGREAALLSAFDPDNDFAREAGRALLEARERPMTDDR
ncbi:MAG: hypothetical protein ACI8XO_002218 [Verrucomicrobiales bacterium]|jgi:hypothetical protein